MMKVVNLLHKPLKFSKGQDVMFWSDLHLRHDRAFIYAPAGFNSVEHMNAEIRHRWCSAVTSETHLFLLGDTAFGTDSGDYLLDFLNGVPFGTLYLMAGNHDTAFRDLLRKFPDGSFKIGDKQVHLIPNYFEIEVGKQFIVLSHYPIISFNKQARGAFHLHGHTHGNLHKDGVMRVIYTGRVMDVGTVLTPRPISFLQVNSILGQVKPVAFDHHTNQNI